MKKPTNLEVKNWLDEVTERDDGDETHKELIAIFMKYVNK